MSMKNALLSACACSVVVALTLMGTVSGRADPSPNGRKPNDRPERSTEALDQRDQESPDGAKEILVNSIGMKFRRIPPGEFMMGAGDPLEELARKTGTMAEYLEDEYPQHRVRITRPFYMGVTEVTQRQWERLTGTQPWSGELHTKDDPESAVTYVTSFQAAKFCKKLSAKDGRTYRLPTEAEWEYACRAGSTTWYCFGDDESKLGEYAWYGANAYRLDHKYAHPVGRKRPNAWGLHGMHGNVCEWCSDWYDEDYYANAPKENPSGPETGSWPVCRGGAWNSGASVCRSSNRAYNVPDNRTYNLGFRVVLEPPE